MHGECIQEAIVLTHDLEALQKRIPVVLRGITAIHEISYDTWHPEEWQLSFFGLLHHADAPIYISRVTVLQVVGNVARNVQTGIKRLVTHQHALFERSPRQLVGYAQMALAKETALAIHNVGVAVEDGGDPTKPPRKGRLGRI